MVTVNAFLNKTNMSSMGTIVTSFLAASCCTGPAIFVITGTSAGLLGKLSFLTPVKPYLLSAGFIMLGYSFQNLYLKNKPECACNDIRMRKFSRSMFWVGFIVLVFVALFPKVVLWFYR